MTRNKQGILASLLFAFSSLSQGQSIWTHHVDNLRTGWNSSETVLTPEVVAGGQFGLLVQVPLDGRVDAQPLVVSDVGVNFGGRSERRDVVYVATQANTVYAIDANDGRVLGSRNFGARGNASFGKVVGISSTPVIDLEAKLLYVITAGDEAQGFAYRLRVLKLEDLSDQQPSVLVAASAKLNNGTDFEFDAPYQRQRPALTLANGNVYAAFGSFYDHGGRLSRGWLLGWNAKTLEPLSTALLLNKQAHNSGGFYLSSIWMSGNGPAVDENGFIYFLTGNSNLNGRDFNQFSNLEESLVKVSADLTTVAGFFTPRNHSQLDNADLDFGAGGGFIASGQF